MEINKELAKELLNMTTSTKNFVLEQAPDVIQQLLTYKYYCYLTGIIIYAIIWLLGGITIPAVITADNRKKYGWEDATCGVFLFAWVITLIISLPLFTEIIPTFLQLIYAPKLYLIEYFTRLLR